MQKAASTRAVLRLILLHFYPINHVLNNFLFGLLPQQPSRSRFLAPCLLHPLFSSFLSSSPHSPTSLSSSSSLLCTVCLASYSCLLLCSCRMLPLASSSSFTANHVPSTCSHQISHGTFSIHGPGISCTNSHAKPRPPFHTARRLP